MVSHLPKPPPRGRLSCVLGTLNKRKRTRWTVGSIHVWPWVAPQMGLVGDNDALDGPTVAQRPERASGGPVLLFFNPLPRP